MKISHGNKRCYSLKTTLGLLTAWAALTVLFRCKLATTNHREETTSLLSNFLQMLQPENNSRIVNSLGGHNSPFLPQVSNYRSQRRDDFTAEMLQPENNSRIVDSLGGHNSPFLPQVSNYRSQRRDDFTAEHHMVMFYMPPIEEGMNTVEVSTPWPRLIVTGQVISARDMPIVLLLLVFLVVLLVIRQ
ncbi:uncharacterized protein LOC121382580 isoform X2 [Gigantopelta aegis]|uniref:uncharacterized protein LOC121382580 isoform X2 n=1 Tax=Gigantopelta aegis TaxID=1735272 RepID=UPI001B88A2E4|nr:uncharacterized protein LOC121382580 isoform X2 [Gigantopelta aegis]XP_041368003.1 uncharacterized protein LOC121382580 isoform X2 [Gigantopelta aegis]XP_041368004.1 uncharacterized protein LOC121382580 isoform X2 [Gigantopelta aegis]